MKIGRFWNTDKIVSIAAILISAGTFFTFIYQTHLVQQQIAMFQEQTLLIQKQQFASAMPYLEMWNTWLDNESYRLVLVNNGTGPAFIEDIKIIYKGKPYDKDPYGFYKQVMYPKDTIAFVYTNIGPGKVIPAGERIELVAANKSSRNSNKLSNWFGNETARVQITYKSIYDESWKITGLGKPPIKVKREEVKNKDI